MIYVSAIYATADESMVTGTDAEGNSETVPADYTIFRQPDDGPVGFVNNGGIIQSYVEPPIVPPVQMLGPISAGTLSILDGEVLGVETSINLAFAFMIDVDTYWAFFTIPEPDTNYLVLGNVPFVRYTDYIEFTAPDPSEVAITTWRVG